VNADFIELMGVFTYFRNNKSIDKSISDSKMAVALCDATKGSRPNKWVSRLGHSESSLKERDQMFTVPEQVLNTQKENFETALAFVGVTAAATEKFLDLNLKMAKATFGDAVKSARAVLEAKDPQELSSLSGAWVQPQAEKYAAYLKTVYGLATETQAELAKLFDGKLSEFNKNLVSALDQAAKNAPAGSEVAVSALKSAMAAANQAYDAFSRASKQVSEVTEATITAATTGSTKKKAA
jgi:phasin family protein